MISSKKFVFDIKVQNSNFRNISNLALSTQLLQMSIYRVNWSLETLKSTDTATSKRNWPNYILKCASSHNLGQNIGEKFTELSKRGFSMENLIGEFCSFPAQLWKFAFFLAGWVLLINSMHFKHFLEIS